MYDQVHGDQKCQFLESARANWINTGEFHRASLKVGAVMILPDMLPCSEGLVCCFCSIDCHRIHQRFVSSYAILF